MLETRVAARTRTHDGELRIHARGITFVPRRSRRTGQLELLNLDGWTLTWDEITDIERVATRTSNGLTPRAARAGTIRVHYAGALRFHELQVQASLRELFAIADMYASLHVAA